MNAVEVAPPESWWLSFLPLIVVGAVILGLIFLIVFGMLISRRVTITVRTGGAVALTLASILLLSGLWCMFLSPLMTYSETKDSFYSPVSIDGLGNWSYSLSAHEEDTLGGSVDGVRAYDLPNGSGKTFNLRIYDPDNSVVWSETNITYRYFSVKALKSGVYKVEVQNPNQQPIECYIQITISEKVTYRPLEPLGQWLSLVSLPTFGFGMWASGVFAIMQKKEMKEPD